MRNAGVIKRCVMISGLLISGMPTFGAAKLDKDTCDQLRGEKVTFVQSGILADFEKGAAWGKTNLSADRLREVEHFILLDEQLKFGCREAVLTQDAKAAGEAAVKLELNPDADPTAPEPDPAQAAGAGSDAAAGADSGRSLADDATAATKPVKRQKPAAAAKPKSKPKDAYVPPPGTESVLEAPADAPESGPKAQ